MDLYARSVEKRGLRYDPYIGDGQRGLQGSSLWSNQSDRKRRRCVSCLRALVRDYKGIFLILDNIYFLENIFFFHLIIYFT